MRQNGSRHSNWRDVRARRREVVERTLPSGMVIFTKRPRLMNFIYGGAPLPKSLLAMAAEGKSLEIDPTNLKELDTSMFAEFVELGGHMMAQCCIEPVVVLVDKENEDELWVGDIDEEDRFDYFQWATGGTDALAGFPETETGVDSSPLAGEGIQHEAEPDSGADG